MELGDFIKNYVCRNTLIRLWFPYQGGHKMIHLNDSEVCMEHELVSDKVWQSQFKKCTVLGVTDIVCNTYAEAVNIVLDAKSVSI